MRCRWGLSNSQVAHQPALSIPVNEHRAIKALHTAPTSQHKPPEVPPFSPRYFCIAGEEGNLERGELSERGAQPTGVLACCCASLCPVYLKKPLAMYSSRENWAPTHFSLSSSWEENAHSPTFHLKQRSFTRICLNKDRWLGKRGWIIPPGRVRWGVWVLVHCNI